MKLICNGLDLAESLSKVTKAITGNSNIPILEGVLISAKGTKLTLTASDTELTIENTINAKIMLEGDIVVPGKLAAELVKKMGSQSVELECIDGKILNIKYMDSNSKLNTYHIEEYPKIIDQDYEVSVSVSEKSLREVINSCVFAAATDDTRPVLKGCLMQFKADKLMCVALDGLRMAITKCDIVSNTDYKSIIVPAHSTLREISKLLSDSEEKCNIYINDKKIKVVTGDTTVIASLINGEFINHERIIPREFNTTVSVVRDQLVDAIERVSIISRNLQSKLIKIEISENVMTLMAKSEIGDIIERVPVNMEGKDMRLAVNSGFVINSLSAINDEYIKLSFTSSTDPFTITPLVGDNYLYLILPVRIMNA